MATPIIYAADKPLPNYAPDHLQNRSIDAIAKARQRDFSQGGVYTDKILEEMESYRESNREKEELSFALARQYRPRPETKASSGMSDHISAEELFEGALPGFSWLSVLWRGVADGVWWYADIWSVLMSLFMTYQFLGHCFGVGYRCLELKHLFGWSRQLLTALCPDFLFMRAYRGMHQENERHQQKCEQGSDFDLSGDRGSIIKKKKGVLKHTSLRSLFPSFTDYKVESEVMEPRAPPPPPPKSPYPFRGLFELNKNLENVDNER